MKRECLNEDELNGRISELKGWKIDGIWLKRRFEYKNFAESLAFVNKVGTIAEDADHHPDIKFGWGYAEIDLTTHDSGGLTVNDFELAAKISDLD